MASFNSDQLANAADQPVVKNHPSTDGKVKRRFFSWTGDAAQSDTVNLVTLKKGERVMAGRVAFSAFGTSVTLDIGTSADSDHYAASADVSAAGGADFANTIALNGAGSEGELTADTTVIATLGGANPASGSLYGWIDVLVV